MKAATRICLAWVDRPYTVVLAAVLIVPGALALIYGDDVSKALSTIAADNISRIMGATLLLGGLLTLTGMARGSAIVEIAGLCALAAGCGIYGFGVILGLGLGGMVAGPISLAIAFATVRRVVTLVSVARVRADEC